MPTEFVMLPPQTDTTREWGARLAAALPEMNVILAENHTHAAGVIAHADAAFGTIPSVLIGGLSTIAVVLISTKIFRELLDADRYDEAPA